MKYAATLLLAVALSTAQQREIGLLAGAAIPTGISIQGTAAGVSAGFGSGPSAGVFIGHDLYSHWSGEIRYVAGFGDAQLKSSGVTAGFSGQTHALHYDVVIHSRRRKDYVRPYLAFGGGMKVFRGTGTETAYRPLMQYAYLTRAQELKPMFTAGGGVKIQLGHRMLARIDFRDQVTPFPTKIITPAPGAKIGGWLHQFVPAFGLSWMF